MREMVLVSPHEPAKVLSALKREMDGFPSLLRTLLSLNAHYFAGRRRSAAPSASVASR
jgi:hypothetical protein